MWIIGDIHGCFTELDKLLSSIPSNDKLLFLGDYVDRGLHSFNVIERILLEKHRSVYLLGNHEEMMIDFLKNNGDKRDHYWLHIHNGGKETLDSYSLNINSNFSDIPVSHQEFLSNLNLYYEDDNFIAVHAGIRVTEDINMENQKKEDLLWIRNEWILNEFKWTGKHIYYGHTSSYMFSENTSFKEFIRGKKSTGLDTGCVYGGYLSAINTKTLDTIQIISENALNPDES